MQYDIESYHQWAEIAKKYKEAILAFAGDPTIKSYELDNGQDRQRVQRHDLEQIKDWLQYAESERDRYAARAGITGDGIVFAGVPGWLGES